MYNCYCIIWAGNVFAILKTEQACENLIRMFADMNHPAPSMTIEGRYIEGVAF